METVGPLRRFFCLRAQGQREAAKRPSIKGHAVRDQKIAMLQLIIAHFFGISY
jgi:hypothetical protein